MSLFGKVLAVLNNLAAVACLYLFLMDYSVRQAWSYANLRYEIALKGMPVDKDDRDVNGQPRYLDMNETLARELVGNDKDFTQEDVLQSRRSDIQNKIENAAIKGSKYEKYIDLLLPLATTAAEREDLLAYKYPEALLPTAVSPGERAELEKRKAKKAKQDYADFAERFNAHFDKALKLTDREGKRAAIARLLVSLIGVLPTEEEKKQREADRNKPLEQRADPTADPDYRKVLNTVGAEQMADAVDLQDRSLRTMIQDVETGRNQARMLFAERHQSLVNTLTDRALQYRELEEQVAAKKAQVEIQKDRAEQQLALVAKLKGEHARAQEVTARQFDLLTQQQEKLFVTRVRLRDANRINQEMEAFVRKLENEHKSKQR